MKLNVLMSYACLALLLDLASLAPAAPTLTALATFNNASNGSQPQSSVVVGPDGNLYGTTYGTTYNGPVVQDGTAYELSGSSHQTLTTLYAFTAATGTDPWGGLLADSSGDLFGTTTLDGGESGDGTVFELSGASHNTLTALAQFTGANGSFPSASLVSDSAGNLYGTTLYGGSANDGTVFELSGPNHQTLTTLLSFTGTNGARPTGRLLVDSSGNVYGTTSTGGDNNNGTVFELSGASHQTYTALATFSGANGSGPGAGLTLVGNNLFGTTEWGGANSDGTVFELSGTNHQTLSTVLSFNSTDGQAPTTDLLADANGNLFGTTSAGGSGADGTIFDLSGSNHQTLTTLWSFSYANTDGSSPSSLVADAFGNLYGTTANGGNQGGGTIGYGEVFELSGSGFTVPEPVSLSLIAAASLLLLGRRRRSPQAENP